MIRNPFLTDEEHEQLLVAWNATQIAYPDHLCIHQLFEAQARATPHDVAVTCDGIELTYCELNQKANQLACYLRSLGMGAEVAAGIYMDHSVDMVVAIVGVLKAGGAYVPLDLRFPRERLSHVLKDIRATVVVTHAHLATKMCRSISWTPRSSRYQWVSQASFLSVEMAWPVGI